MTALLILVLSAALGRLPGTELEFREVAFAELPPECAAEYDPELRRFRGASATRVGRCDLDGDGSEELLVWTGESGSGGETWSVMTKRGGRFRRAGRLFGTLRFVGRGPRRGLAVGTFRGWEHAAWEYWELEDGLLKSRLALDIRYLPPEGGVLRNRPAEIRIAEKP